MTMSMLRTAALVVMCGAHVDAFSCAFSTFCPSSLRPVRAACVLRMSFEKADELHAAGKIKEAIAELGAMEGSDSYVRRSRWTVDISESMDKDARLPVLKEAEADALRAVELDANNFAAWKAAAIVKGKMQKCVGTNEKVALTKEVKENIEKALELNPDDGASWHVLGMWHTGVSNLNFMMKAALKALFGGMPEASHDKAIECFLKADACKPNLTTTVELAKVYKTVGKNKECKEALEKALTMDTSLPVYRVAQEEAREMLAKM